MKVTQLPYSRFDTAKSEDKIREIIGKIKAAASADEVLRLHNEVVKEISSFSTMASIANMRFTLNTFDEFYLAEKSYYEEVSPVYAEVINDFGKAMLACPFEISGLNPIVFEKYRIMAAASDPRIIEEKQKEAEICVEYNQLMSSINFEFDGKEMPLSVLRGYLSESDRNVRKAACEALGRGLEKHSEQLDDIFDRLVHIRDKQAKKLGYKNYVELGYLNMERMDYNREMVESFRAGVIEFLLPVIKDIKAKVAQKLCIDNFMFYDDAVCFNDGEPKPILNKEQIFCEAQKMYDEMNPKVGEFMRSMIENDAFDVDARKGKWGGGYCTNFNDYKQTFILANFNGSSDDIDVITHEFGHALAMDFAFNYGDPELFIGGCETAECHSMSMEFLSWPYMEKFFGKDADKYRYKHLLSSLSFIPYGSIVDEFQHIVYTNPDMTPAQRNQAYLDLEKKYRPYLSFEGIPYLEKGTRWQYQMHIYESPFYYIDYCLAQTVALSFLVDSRKNYDSALGRYLDFCKKGGTVYFSELCKQAGFKSPFEAGALADIAKYIPEILEKLI